MNFKRSFGWVLVILATVAGMAILTVGFGQWRIHSLDEQGRALVAEGEYLPAVRVLLHAVTEAPGDARAHYYLGLAYAGIGLCGAAWIHLEEASRLAPTNGRPGAGLGPACRGPMTEPLVVGQFDRAVHRGR
jgi:cytochrome c-type biogenesis protein CcmH/NrfG